jgi:hypothetical protein
LRLLQGELRPLLREPRRWLEARHQIHHGFGKDDAQDGDRSEEWQHEGEDGVGEVPGVLFTVFGDTLDEERDEGRVEDATQEEVVD